VKAAAQSGDMRVEDAGPPPPRDDRTGPRPPPKGKPPYKPRGGPPHKGKRGPPKR